MTEIKPGTPLPWRTAGGDAILAGRDEALVVVGSAEREDDSSYIVTACNDRPSLLNGLREAREALEAIVDALMDGDEYEAYAIAKNSGKDALAKLDTLLSQEGGQ